MATLWKNYRYLVLRRVVQLTLLLLYFGGNAWGWTLLRGNLSTSLLLGAVPLSDPFAVMQMLAAGALLAADLMIGAAIVTTFYFFIGGRLFCSWVCPVNMITDAANYLREKWQFNRIQGHQPASRSMRYWVLGLSLVLSFFMGVAAFEFISPISMVHRGIVFGLGFGWAAMLIIFLFDLLVLKNGWCGHICPLGGFYALVGRFSLIRVYHDERQCTLCMKCKEVCPEHQVLHMVGKESASVLMGECTNCARCIEVCTDEAMRFSIRKVTEEKNQGAKDEISN